MMMLGLLGAGWGAREAVQQYTAVLSDLTLEVQNNGDLLERVAWYQCGILRMHGERYDLKCQSIVRKLGEPPGALEGHP